MPLALGIETSCDDTCVSLVDETGRVLFNGAQNQNSIHRDYGGIVPELAGRNHGARLLPLVEEALKTASLEEIDLIAVTNRPGLLGSLLVGSVTAQALSLTWKKPVLGINHIEGHIFSPFLWTQSAQKREITYPFLALVASGGHSHLFYVKGPGRSVLLGQALDDAAGEALDKLAKLLNLPFPGGPQIEREAQTVGPVKKKFFSQIKTQGLSFSFSGIKSSGRRLISSHSSEWLREHQGAVCADYQETIMEHLMEKLDKALKLHPCSQVIVGGGVSANGVLRGKLREWATAKDVEWAAPQPPYCTDNAAMIAFTGLKYFLQGGEGGKGASSLPFSCSPRHLDRDFFIRPLKSRQN